MVELGILLMLHKHTSAWAHSQSPVGLEFWGGSCRTVLPCPAAAAPSHFNKVKHSQAVESVTCVFGGLGAEAAGLQRRRFPLLPLCLAARPALHWRGRQPRQPVAAAASRVQGLCRSRFRGGCRPWTCTGRLDILCASRVHRWVAFCRRGSCAFAVVPLCGRCCCGTDGCERRVWSAAGPASTQQSIHQQYYSPVRVPSHLRRLSAWQQAVRMSWTKPMRT